MVDYPKRAFSKAAIKAAGQRLREVLPYTEDVVETFRIAHNWRMAHAYPMLQERRVLARICGQGDTAGRIKRMASIRKKLARSPVTLDRMQDLAGIRAILPDIQAVTAAASWYQSDRHGERIKKSNDYIASPKKSGYRSIHLIREYRGTSEWSGMRVEIQLRTRLQHVWATAGEAIGAMRNEDLKGGEGNPDWLRLLALMSDHFADKECQPRGTGLGPNERRDEIAGLERKLGAISFLSAFRTATSSVPSDAKAFLLHLDAGRGTVTVEAKRSYVDASEGYFAQADAGEVIQTLLVSVDGMDALRRTYPNYFLDVGQFLHELRVASGRISFIERADLSFLQS